MVERIFANQVRKARQEKGWSAYDLGERLGVRDLAVYRWERAKTWPQPETIDKLAEVLDKPAHWFFTPDEGGAIFGVTGANEAPAALPLEKRKAAPRKTSKVDAPNRRLKVGDVDRNKRGLIQCQAPVRLQQAS